MTIQERIGSGLQKLQKADLELYKKVTKLQESVERINDQLNVHLGEISTQMTEYDDHGASHSRKVLENIEKLLQDDGIGRLSLLEAIVLRLCCYFHDSGMILPDCYSPLLANIEKDPTGELPEDLRPWLKEKKKQFDDVQEQFYCPETEDGYEEFLLAELDKYQKYRMGLPEELSGEARFLHTRHDYLRGTHGQRAAIYAKNLLRFFDGIPYGGKSDLAKAVGDICAAHCLEFGEVRKLDTGVEIIDACPELRCNVQYLAMLLRLGDVIHFSSDRASRTAYAERSAMDADSELHWKTKFEDLHYTIKPDGSGVSIAYYAGFDDPKAYYFLQNHLDQVDEELQNYRAFVSDMRGEEDADRYAIGLPTKVVRDSVRAVNFKPDQDLKFRLEHRKIITLLMGMRLYRDEFMCLRELYQNALDACRCMRAENEMKGLTGELKIEFGLGSDKGGDYLYCKDEGTGMTMEIVKNYLLRIGNSYYQSDEFRRSNAQWGGKVAPVSEFGIGLLSCYMIASRIEVITRHHTRTAEPPIWVCMEDSDDYGYFRTPGRLQNNQVGNHGTYVKLYLKEEFKERVTGYLPENPEDAVYELTAVWNMIRNKKDEEKETNEAISISTGVPMDTIEEVSLFSYSLYSKIQQFIHKPEVGIPIFVNGSNSKRMELINALKPYIFSEKLEKLRKKGFSTRDLLNRGDIPHANTLFLFSRLLQKKQDSDETIEHWCKQFVFRGCSIHDIPTNASAYTILHFPAVPSFDVPLGLNQQIDQFISSVDALTQNTVYIDGMPITSYAIDLLSHNRLVDKGIKYDFSGTIRPALTVDRGDIRAIPDSVVDLSQHLKKKLVKEIAQQIETYFQQHTDLLTQEILHYENIYICSKYSLELYYNLFSLLADGVYKDYRVYGIRMQELFYLEKLVFPDFTKHHKSESGYALLSVVLGKSKYIAVDEYAVTVVRPALRTGEWVSLEVDYEDRNHMIIADEWTGLYAQYDIVDCLWPIIPSRIRDILPDADPKTHILSYKQKQRWMDLRYLVDFSAVPVEGNHGASSVSDVLLSLQEEYDQRQIHTYRYSIRTYRETKQYVIYMYCCPQTLTKEQADFVDHYAHVPQYREGVEKGWSILFYNYKDGYVIAPGIVDRMEMLKLLPDEALNHDDGLEYYFTDGTRAF